MSTTARHLERIARGGTLSVAGAGVAALSGFVVVALITNGYSKSEAGVLFSASSLFLVLVALAGLGMEVGLGRFVMRYLVEARPAAVRADLRNTAAVSTTIGLVLGVALFLAAPQVASAIGLADAAGTDLLRVFAVALPFAAIGNWALGASRAFQEIRLTVLIDKLFRALAQLALVALCVGLARGLVELAWAWALPMLLSAPLALWGLRRVARRRLPAPAAAESSVGVVSEFWRFTWPRSIAQISQMVIQRADIIIIGALISPAAAAVYTAATRFVPLGQIGVQAVQQVIQPRFTELLATDDTESLRDVFRITTSWNMALAWPIYAVIGSVPQLYLSIFGEGFVEQGRWVVVLMAVAMLAGVASGPVDTMLLMSGRSSLSLVNSLVALAIDLTLCFLLIPRVGIVGAAVAWCAAVVSRALLGYVQVRRTLGLSPLSTGSGRVALAVVGCFGLPLTALSVLGQGLNLWLVALVFAVGVLAYGGVLWKLRSRLHLSALRSLLPGRRRKGGEQ
jgi:O-antigen/teichoic acid export membrane protein